MKQLLSRAVVCQYRGGGHCTKTTKDTSELCHHHRRNNLQHSTSADSAPKLRLAEATMRIRTGDQAAVNGKTVLDWMPVVHRSANVVAVERGTASTVTDTVIWNDTQYTLEQHVPAVYNAHGLSYPIIKDGTTLKAKFPENASETERSTIVAQAYTTRNHTAFRLFKSQGMFDGLGERYDDKAEVLVQLPLNEDRSLSVSYSSPDNDTIKVRMHSVNSEGKDQTETYTVSIKQFSLTSAGTLMPNNEVDMPGTLTVDGNAYPVPEALSNQRAQFFHNLTEALNVIDTYSCTGSDDALYLPVGWMER